MGCWKNNQKEYELVPQFEASKKKTGEKIYRCPAMVKKINRRQYIQDPGESDPGQARLSGQSMLYNGQQDDSLFSFGPFYAVGGQEGLSEIKEKAWNHVTRSVSRKDPGRAKEAYAVAVRRVEKEAKEIYGEKIVGTNSEFRLMMVNDGCFFLQLAFLILGKSEELGYSKKNEIFGKRIHKKDKKKWIKAMFYIGNQIPFVVLNELLKERFFRDVIEKAKLDPHPADSLYKKVMFKMLVLPDKDSILEQKPCDLLHALHIMVVGSSPLDRKPSIHRKDEDTDLEANIEEEDDQRTYPWEEEEDDSDLEEDNHQGIFPSDTVNNNTSAARGGRLKSILRAMGLKNAADDNKVVFPCAIELEQAGIHIKKNKSEGIKSIKFKNWYFRAYLYLPTLLVDDGTEILFRNLKTYDQVSQKSSEVSSYLLLMRDMIQTGQDVRLLENKRIIEGDSDDTEKLPRILNKLVGSERVTLTHEFHNLRRKIRNYSNPWAPYRNILNIALFLTVLQALLALLAYVRPPQP